MDIDPPDPASSPSYSEIKNALYARCASLPSEKIFSQHDLLNLNIVPNDDVKLLLQYTVDLTKEGLLKVLNKDGRACWRVVKREDAKKYRSLTAEEAIVYSYIESAGREGIWSRILRSRSGLHMTVMTNCLKVLESKNYVKPIKTVKFPNRKTYMLAGLQPSDDVTGGPFYTDSVLDDEFVHQMANLTERYIVGRSWYQHTSDQDHAPHNSKKKGSKQQELSKEEAELQRSFALKSSSTSASREPKTSNSITLLPFPPGYTGYPTIAEITRAVNTSQVSQVMMKEAEMKQLIDILVWDGRIEKMQFGEGYKAIRRAALAVMSGQRERDNERLAEGGESKEEGGSALTEAPCGRCPVMGLCEEDGPVSARTCEYFADWLKI
ncbi:MAG: hypothetical protein Q9220_002555 [cf. Caloplaca sp. 1 TL-2023]